MYGHLSAFLSLFPSKNLRNETSKKPSWKKRHALGDFTKIANNKDYHFDIMDMEVDFKSGSVQPINSIIPIRINILTLSIWHTNSITMRWISKETTSSRPININLTLQSTASC